MEDNFFDFTNWLQVENIVVEMANWLYDENFDIYYMYFLEFDDPIDPLNECMAYASLLD